MPRANELLDAYRKRRDFSKTIEPRGKNASKRQGNIFVVQKHDATRLHFDFRLEMDGVLKSWAVTRGPSYDPAKKRLAVRTEDHPLEYATFEGTIPKSEYGGGTVMLWDFGTWEPLEDPRKGLKAGKLKLRLDGKRMKGGWSLIRMTGGKNEKRENWLLIKERDEHARDNKDATGNTSVSTGRTMSAIARGAPQATERGKTRKSATKLPEYVSPQLATLVDNVPTGPDWLFELKYDGYRVIAAVAGDKVRLYTRNGHDWTKRFGALVEPFRGLTKGTALVDGEVCAFDEHGKTSFSVLKDHLSNGGALTFFAFDLLEKDGQSLRNRPLSDRKTALETLIGRRARHDRIQYSPDIVGRGQEVFDGVCSAGHEGVIAKKADAPYRSSRTKSWLKIKCVLRQEFIIVGWSPSDRRSGSFASLLLATEEKGKLVYRGRVGTGYPEQLREELDAQLARLARKTPPVTDVPAPVARNARWVTPKLVGEIAFTELTRDGHLRHPSFVGLREDKPAKGIALEEPAGSRAPDKPAKPAERGSARPSAAAIDADAGIAAAEAARVKLTNPDRILYPDQGVTKAELAAYYARVADTMLSFAANRPISLVRCPSGRAKQCFFQRHDAGGFGRGVKRVDIVEKDGATGEYIYVTGLDGILSCVQMSVLEFHIWGARRDRIENPDRLIFDIDPDVGLDFGDVRSAAIDIRDRLDRLGLKSFAMVTGGKGVHVVSPLVRSAQWPAVKAFASGFAKRMETEEPERFTASMSKARRKGRIFVDYLRNERGSTAIVPFSTRARRGAPVAVPVSWDELIKLNSASGFDLERAAERATQPSPWDGYNKLRQHLPDLPD